MRVTALQSIGVADLEPVLAEEAAAWKSQLHWDFDSAMELIRSHVSIKALPGAALEGPRGRTIGYGYSLVDGCVGYVGNVYILSCLATSEAYLLLIEELVGRLLKNRQVRRIEGQVFPFNFDFGHLFERSGIGLVRRRYLERELPSLSAADGKNRPGYRLEAWEPSLLSETARIIFLSYQNSSDWHLCSDYQSVRGCRRFLSNLVAGPGCGTFSAPDSLALFTSKGDLIAVLLVTQIAPDTVMIPQISVHPDHQRQGLGTLLLEHFLSANRGGNRRVSLSVSCPNQGALRLYERLGFRMRKEFFGLVYEVSAL